MHLWGYGLVVRWKGCEGEVGGQERRVGDEVVVFTGGYGEVEEVRWKMEGVDRLTLGNNKRGMGFCVLGQKKKRVGLVCVYFGFKGLVLGSIWFV
jgi:hypothetical protein